MNNYKKYLKYKNKYIELQKYINNHQLGGSLRTSDYELQRIFLDTVNRVDQVIVFNTESKEDKKIISRNISDQLKVWDIVSGLCIQTMSLNDTIVYNIEQLDSKRVVISCDEKLCVWTVGSEELHVIIESQTNNTMYFTVINSNKLVIHEYGDPYIRLFNITSGEFINELLRHDGNVNDVKLLDINRCVSSSDDMTIKIWNTDDGKCIKTIIVDSIPFTINVIDNNRIACYHRDGIVRVWQIDSVQCIFHTTIDPDNAINAFCVINNDNIATVHVHGPADNRSSKMIKIWNINSWNIVQTIITDRELVGTSIAKLNDNHFMICCSDNTITIWKCK